MNQQSFQALIADVEAGEIHLKISCSFRLDEIAAAHQFMESNAGAGKIVVLTGA